MTYSSILTLLLVLIYSTAFSGSSSVVRGAVRDMEGKPIPGATVHIQNNDMERTDRGGICREDGTFSVSGIPAGIYIARVTAIGHEACKTLWVVNRDTIEMVIVLKEKPIQSDTLLVQDFRIKKLKKPDPSVWIDNGDPKPEIKGLQSQRIRSSMINPYRIGHWHIWWPNSIDNYGW